MRLLGGLACSFVLATSVCHAASVCVNPGGTGGCLASIQQAVTAVAPRGRIDVAAGTYAESVIIPVGASLQIYGAGAGLTIIDGADGDTVVRVDTNSNTTGSKLAISDVTLTGGSPGPQRGSQRIHPIPWVDLTVYHYGQHGRRRVTRRRAEDDRL